MARQVYYSFHYKADAWRAGQVRNIGTVDGNKPVSDNDWEAVERGGDVAIEKWIAEQMQGRSCTIVLIGKDTAGRKWIDYEIRKTWNDKKGVVGIYVHNLKNQEGYQPSQGRNPLADIPLTDGKKLSDYAKAYNPPFNLSTDVYNYIRDNISDWVEEAVRIRNG
jgi:hypothetical protein